MLDRDLTIERGLSEIGEIIQESRITITSQSPIVQFLKTARLRYNELFAAGKVYIDTGIFSGIRLEECKVSAEEHQDLERELSKLGSNVSNELVEMLWRSVPYDKSAVMAASPSFSDPFYEAIQNAIEHGTNFCENDNVEVHCTMGTEGILAVISQPTHGLTRERVEKALTCKDAGELIYKPTPAEIRGMGLASYRSSKNAQVWFEFVGEESSEFRVIILQTRKRLFELH